MLIKITGKICKEIAKSGIAILASELSRAFMKKTVDESFEQFHQIHNMCWNKWHERRTKSNKPPEENYEEYVI